ncbi:MAG: CbtB-domain containing protein [Actinomycetota bacterium]
MERTMDRVTGAGKTLLPALYMAVVVFAMVTIAFGIDHAVPGAHDAFHDFRHVFGLPCH